MIVVAVATILLTVAVPSLLSQIRKARRSDATDASVAILQAQERYRANNTSYAAALASIGLGASSSNGYYTLALSNASATSYTVTASAVGGTTQAGDAGCSTLTVGVTNGSATYGPAACWSR